METSSAIGKTLFREEAEEYQEEQKRTKSTGLKNALYWAGFSALGLVLTTIIFILFPEEIPALLILMIPVFAGGILYGLYGIISNAIRSTKEVTCPSCGAVHEIFKKERLYMCTDCGTLLNMGKDVETPIGFVSCPYCGHQAAVSKDHGPFHCYNCGVTRSSTEATVEIETTKCSSCDEIVPQEALYCKHCGQLLKPLPPYDMDWKVGKDANGHFQFARMLLATFPAKEAAIATMLTSGDPKSGGRRWTTPLNELRSLLERLGEVQRSLEVALQEQELRTSVEGLLPYIDILYGRLLLLELRTFMWAEGPEHHKLQVRAYGSYFEPFAKGPQILARKRLEKILGSESLQSAGSIGAWDDGYLVLATSEQPVEDPTKPATMELVGYSGLQAEAKRFAEWAKESGHTADLLDTFHGLQETTALRERGEQPVGATPAAAEKVETIKTAEPVTGPVASTSSTPVAPKVSRSPSGSAKSKRATVRVLVISGLSVLAFGICCLASLTAMMFSDPEGLEYSQLETFFRTLLCTSPFYLIGFVLLLAGFFVNRAQKKELSSVPTGLQPGGRPPGDPKALFRDGLALFNQEKYREAIPILEKAAEVDPTYAPVQFTLGGAYLRVAGEYGNDEDAARHWGNKSAEAFRKSLEIASQYGGLDDNQLTLARNTVKTFEDAETAYQMQREVTSLPEDQRKQIYADFMETKDSELLQGIDIQDFTESSRRGDLAQMARSLERNAAEAEKVAIAKITEKYGISVELLTRIADEGKEKEWPFEEIKGSNS
ncbi:MAG: hypothetical protein GTO18_00260 [Anaerolineales bacterium]|nr:hypothetical protein [Anaerolineales bacterium]